MTRKALFLSVTYLHYRVASRQSLHRPSAAFSFVVGPVVGLWLHLNLEVVRARAGGKLPVKSRQRWAERQIICPIKKAIIIENTEIYTCKSILM